MKKITVWSAALLMCFGLLAATPQQADARRWHGGGGWGFGLAAGLIGAGLLYGAYRPYYGGYYGYGYPGYRPYYRPYYASYYYPSYSYYRPYRYRAFYGSPRYYRRHWKGWR